MKAIDVELMAVDPMILAMANPVPEIMPTPLDRTVTPKVAKAVRNAASG